MATQLHFSEVPPPPRPRCDSLEVVNAAKERFLAEGATDKSLAAVCEGNAVGYADDLARYYTPHDDGYELAKRLERRACYENDEALQDIASKFIAHVRNAFRDATISWIEGTRQKAPFNGVARVEARTSAHSPSPADGAAYFSEQYARIGQCLFVPDAEREKHLQNGRFTGGVVIDWENIFAVRPPTVCDRAAYDCKVAEDKRSERESRRSRYIAAARAEFEAKVAEHGKALVSLSKDELARRIQSLSQGLQFPEFVPSSTVAAELTATLAILRRKIAASSFEAAEEIDDTSADA